MTERLHHPEKWMQLQFGIDTKDLSRKDAVAVSGSGDRMLRITNETDQAVGMQLQSLRVFAGMTLEAASTKLNINPEDLAAYEAGEQRLQPIVVLSIASGYGVPPSRIFELLTASLHS